MEHLSPLCNINIIINVNILLDFVKDINKIKTTITNIISFINDKIDENRISDKDTSAIIKYISKNNDKIIALFFNYYAKLNKFNMIQDLIKNAKNKEDISFSIIDQEQKNNYLGVIYPLDEYAQMVNDLENINTYMNSLKEEINAINKKITVDVDKDLRKPKDKIIKFHLVKPYPVQETTNYINDLNNIMDYMKKITYYIDICIESIFTYLEESCILKSKQYIDNYYDNYEDTVKFIFMPFDITEE